MAGPLSGLSQQVPFATTFQPSQASNAQVRPDAKKPQENVVQARNAPASGSQKSETRDQNVLRGAASKSASSGNGQRGTLLDVTV
ncbi:MAG: hypothetical protein ACT4OY_06805 [Alphaproteobacteria bacterium]